MSKVSQVSNTKRKPVHHNELGTKMNDTLHMKFVASANKSTCGTGTLHMKPSKRRRNISYNIHEDHIIEYTDKLMKRHRLGYSGLHKWLILKEAQTQFGTPFV